MKDKLPLVSIIIPSYNHEKYVIDSINSVLNQTYQNIELIVIDDGSKDNSVSIIRDLSKKYGFKFINRENRGLSATLNEGIKISSGKYISILASDDKIIEYKIEKQVQFMEENPDYMASYGNRIIIYGKIERKDIVNNAKSGWIFHELLTAKISIPALTSIINKSVFNYIGYYDENLWIEDWDMWLRIAEKYQIGYLNEYLAYYRKHDTNISFQLLKMYKAQKEILQKWKSYDKYKEVMEIWKLIWFSYLSKNYKIEAKPYLFLAIKKIYRIRNLKSVIKFFFIRKG